MLLPPNDRHRDLLMGYGGLPVARTMSAARLNAIANHPSVRPWLGGDSVIDLEPVLLNPANFAFETEHGGMVLAQIGNGVYEVHSLFLPEGRGPESSQAFDAVADYMFAVTDCIEVRTRAMEDNRRAVAAAKRQGFEQRYAMPVPWHDGALALATFWSLTAERWALTADRPQSLGEWFHVQLALAQGGDFQLHADEVVHDRMVGAMGLMACSGQGEKAVRFYNAWAALTGYHPVQLLREHPVVIDLHDAVVEVRNGSMEVLLCR